MPPAVIVEEAVVILIETQRPPDYWDILIGDMEMELRYAVAAGKAEMFGYQFEPVAVAVAEN